MDVPSYGFDPFITVFGAVLLWQYARGLLARRPRGRRVISTVRYRRGGLRVSVRISYAPARSETK